MEIVGSDALRIILAHLHKVIFNCLYQNSKSTLKLFLMRKWYLHFVGKRILYQAKVRWSLPNVKTRSALHLGQMRQYGWKDQNQALHLNYTTEESTGNKITKLKTHLRSDRQIQTSSSHSQTWSMPLNTGKRDVSKIGQVRTSENSPTIKENKNTGKNDHKQLLQY